jgi:hypothetical protein
MRKNAMSDAFTQEQREADVDAFFDDPHFEESLLSCWGVGLLEVCVKKIADDRIEVDIKLAGQRIGQGTLTASHARICASASLLLVKAQVCVRADFPGKTVWVEGEFCTKNFPSGWSCRKFKTKILSW